MARFTDQFNRYDPENFSPFLAMVTWPPMVKVDALELLDDVSSLYWQDIAEACEKLIETESNSASFPLDQNAWIWSRIVPGTTARIEIGAPHEIRNEFHDLNLLLYAIEHKKLIEPKWAKQGIHPWHFLAVLALWKLIDAIDVLFERSSQFIGGRISDKREIRITQAATIAMEAQAAISNAQQLKARARHVEEMRLAVLEKEQKKRSGIASGAGKTRAQIYEDIANEAFKIATNLTKRYINNDKVAEAIYDELQSKYHVPFKPSSVKRWLAERGWKRKK